MMLRRSYRYVPLITKAILLMNLSLFFVMLAFFIALNGISIVNHNRYQAVMGSIEDAFSITVIPDRIGKGLTSAADPEKSYLEGDTLARVDGLFNAQIEGFKADTSRNGVMHVQLPLEELDRALKTPNQVDLTKVARPSELQSYFLPTLVTFLRAAQRSDAYRMDVLLHSRDNPALLVNSDPAVLKEIAERAGAYAALLTQAGLDASLMTVGIVQGDPQSADIYFLPLEAPAAAGGNAP